MLIWLIDDMDHWQAVTQETLRVGNRAWRFAGFLNAQAGLMAYDHALRSGGAALPQVLLLDFYIGRDRGDAVALRAWRDPEKDHQAPRSTVVKYSSVLSGSRTICQNGGDVVVRKHNNDAGWNPSLWQWLLEHPDSPSEGVA